MDMVQTQEVVADGITQTPQTNVEENNIADNTTQNTTDNIENVADVLSPVETDGVTNTPEDNTTDVKEEATAPTVEQLQDRLREYELKEQETANLKARLGIEESQQPESLQLDTIEATIDNRAQQNWIQLCNRYGIDYTPQGIESSSKQLLEKDPKLYYEFMASSKELYNNVESSKAQVKQTKNNYEVNQFVSQNKAILDNSPVVSQVISNYLEQNYNSMVNPLQELNGVMDLVKAVYAEALEVGQHMAKVDTVTKDRTGVSGSASIATTSTPVYPMDNGQKIFTRAEIRNMDNATFQKYEKVISDQMVKGLIV